jgi:hypothetical protein
MDLQLLHLNGQTPPCTLHMHLFSASALNYLHIPKFSEIYALEFVLLTQYNLVLLESHIYCVVD